MAPSRPKNVLVTGATGFIGQALLPALTAAGHRVSAASRGRPRADAKGVTWVQCDLMDPASLVGALRGMDAVYYLVHSMGSGHSDYAGREHASALNFARVAAAEGVGRIIYLGGVAPQGTPSRHLASRLGVGDALRAGTVPCLELRASMVIGNGSQSWKIVRDLGLRLPAMVLPTWLRSKTRPVALSDVIRALVAGVNLPLKESVWYDLPGPEVLDGREILMRIAALRKRRIPLIEVPLLTPALSALWLKLVSGAKFELARELVLGLSEDLLPRDEHYYELTDHPPRIGFDAAARQALEEERQPSTLREHLGNIEEELVARWGPRTH